MFSYFFLQVDNKADTRVLSFYVRKDNWKRLKKKGFSFIVSINFTTLLIFGEIDSYLLKRMLKENVFWNFQTNAKKNGFLFCFFLEIG